MMIGMDATAESTRSDILETPPLARAADTAHVAEVAARISQSIGGVLAGRGDAVATAIACLLSGGHLLIEDIPGVGKTLLAQALASSVGGSFHRIQGTPDLLPGDVTGTMMPHGDSFEMHFRPGPIFSNIVVFDELNRANPRTQSALLEATEESAVTVDGVTRALPSPTRSARAPLIDSPPSSHPDAPGPTTRSRCSPAAVGAISCARSCRWSTSMMS